ncbi:MAG: DUF47 family protein [Gammaproteobacteria bacterium]|nr:DUF47 family protein [Gammaproteobacteria bacterium]
MHAEKQPTSETRPLQSIFRAHIDNSVACSHVLKDLFANVTEPYPHITRIKQLEEAGDALTAEAYYVLESHEYSSLTHIIEDLIKFLDDIVDGFNKTARLIDIFRTSRIEAAAFEILSRQQAMLERLAQEIKLYPDNDPGALGACRGTLKEEEENVDLIYHEWRKKERRVHELSLIDEYNWTEIFDVLEQTTDDIYHTAIILEKIVRHRLKSAVPASAQ